MKLNKKGYMLVEIILSAVLAMSIAIYLLNLTYDFKNKNEDIYQSILYSSDKLAITKNIMNDLDQVMVTNIKNIDQVDKNNILIEFYVKTKGKEEAGQDELRRLTIVKNSITYGKVKNDNTIDVKDVSYYQKTLQSSLIIDTQKIAITSNEQYVQISIPVYSMYEDQRYSIHLLVSKYLETALNGSFKIVYNRNGGTGGSMGESEHFYNVSSTLSANQFKKEYTVKFDDSYTGNCVWNEDTEGEDGELSAYPEYFPSTLNYDIRKGEASFKGWAFTPTGEVQYQDAETITISSELENNTLTLYAIWGDFSSIVLPNAQSPTVNFQYLGWFYNGIRVGGNGSTWAPANTNFENQINLKAKYEDTSGSNDWC